MDALLPLFYSFFFLILRSLNIFLYLIKDLPRIFCYCYKAFFRFCFFFFWRTILCRAEVDCISFSFQEESENTIIWAFSVYPCVTICICKRKIFFCDKGMTLAFFYACIFIAIFIGTIAETEAWGITTTFRNLY